MIVRSFKSVIWVGAVGAAALSCYMVSLRVASERASLESVESRILMAKRDIRSLDTELTTRGRIRQLERWNTDVLALAAPTEAQFLENEVQLASLTRIDPVGPAPLVMFASSEETSKPHTVFATYRPDDMKPPARLVLASMPKITSSQAIVAKLKPIEVARVEAKPAPKLKAVPKVVVAARVPDKAKPASVRLAGASKPKPVLSKAIAAASKLAKPVKAAAAEVKTAAKPKAVSKIKVAALASERAKPGNRR